MGLRVTRIARTGGINQVTPMLDYISLRAFLKEGVRRSTYHETFGFWIPLFLSNETKEQTLELGKRAMSYISTNNTRRFDPSMAYKVLIRGIFTVFLRLSE